MGGALTALAPDFQNAVLGVPAINYSVLLRRSVDFDAYATIMYDQYPNERERPLVLGLMQMLWDRGEGQRLRAAHGRRPAAGHARPQRPDARRDRRPPGLDDPGRRDGADDRGERAPARDRRRAVARGQAAVRHPGDRRVPVHGRRRGRVLGHRARRGSRTASRSAPIPRRSEEVPNRSGADPHGRPRKDPNAQIQKVEFMLNGDVIDVCGSAPCYVDGYTGP